LQVLTLSHDDDSLLLPMDKQYIINHIQTDLPYLKTHFHLTKIGLFGSFAREENQFNSDIDILIEFENNIHHIFETKKELQSRLQACFNRSVDIAREKYLKPSIKQQILKETIYVQ
jgi:predicted nucleotidyltransferase